MQNPVVIVQAQGKALCGKANGDRPFLAHIGGETHKQSVSKTSLVF
jgi:hypothetical protein